MRAFFYKEVVPPDMPTRNKLLRKLVYLRASKTEGVKELRKTLRRMIKQTYGKTLYYRFHKGVLIHLGDETTKKKYFLIYRENDSIGDKLRNLRVKGKEIKQSDRYKRVGRFDIKYKKVGGVLSTPGLFPKFDFELKRQRVYELKTPKTSDDYVGIELEYASALSIDELASLIAELRLQDSVRAMRDGSIDIFLKQFPYQVELCILAKMSELPDILKRLEAIINPKICTVNDSCGFHVHIDARNGDKVKSIFTNLASMQNVLFKLVNASRRESRFCHPIETTNFDEASHTDHYAAVSKSSYIKHKTIEVRIHHSTLDLTLVSKWVNLLKRIADYKGNELKMGTLESEYGLLKTKVGLDSDLIKYVDERMAL